MTKEERPMKPILFLTDETESAEPSLQNVAGIKVKAHAREGAPGCKCDRWGHPCPDCDERKIQPKAELPISSPAKKPS
jgi:hypothetical protein